MGIVIDYQIKHIFQEIILLAKMPVLKLINKFKNINKFY